MSAGRILVVRGGAIGDFILTLPVFAALRAQFPGARIEVLGYPHIAGLAHAGGLVDEVRSIEARSLAGFFARNGNLDESLQEYFAQFAVILSYLYDPDAIFQTNVARCSKAQFIAGPHRPDELAEIHATEVFLKPLERLAIFGADPIPKLTLPEKQKTDPGTISLAAHPGSGSPEKNWPEEKWRELLVKLGGISKLRLVLVGGEAEGDRLARLSGELSKERLELVRNQPMPQLASRLAACDGFIGHDSGITHLAAAMGTRVIALWGRSAFPVWRPCGSKVMVIRPYRQLSELQPSDVFSACCTYFKLQTVGE